MRFTKTRKPRGIKQNGERSYDLCPCCYSPYCDPSLRHPSVEQRMRNGLCPACGKPLDLCICRSGKTSRIVVHNNKHIRTYQNGREHLLQLAKTLCAKYESVSDAYMLYDNICHISFKTVNGQKRYHAAIHCIQSSGTLTKSEKTQLIRCIEQLSAAAKKI